MLLWGQVGRETGQKTIRCVFMCILDLDTLGSALHHLPELLLSSYSANAGGTGITHAIITVSVKCLEKYMGKSAPKFLHLAATLIVRLMTSYVWEHRHTSKIQRPQFFPQFS